MKSNERAVHESCPRHGSRLASLERSEPFLKALHAASPHAILSVSSRCVSLSSSRLPFVSVFPGPAALQCGCRPVPAPGLVGRTDSAS